jgi:hypothetical protein
MQISGSHFIPIELESLAGSPRKLCFLHFVNDPSLHPKYEQLCSKILMCFIGISDCSVRHFYFFKVK